MAVLSNDMKKYLMDIKPEDITLTLFTDLFADTATRDGKVKPSKIKTTDEFVLEKGEYTNNEKIRTNAGLFIYNKFLFEKELHKVVGYINDPVDGSKLGEIETKLATALRRDDITPEVFVKYLNDLQWLANTMHTVICGSFTMSSLKPNKAVIDQREKLIKENKEKLEAGDASVAVKIENQLLDTATKQLGDDPGLYLYASKARGSFGNNYKNISVMKGPVFNPETGKFDIVRTNFMEGISKEDIPVYGNTVITGSYPKAIGTGVSGYFSKQITAALQAVQLDKKGSDCQSKGLLHVLITKSNYKDYLYRYIVVGNKLVLLDDDVIGKYVGTEVKMRSPMFCTSKKICRVCAGLMYEKINIENIGLTASRVSSTLLNLSMKKFHNSSTKIYSIDIKDIVL